MFTFFLDRGIELTTEEPFDSRCAHLSTQQLWISYGSMST